MDWPVIVRLSSLAKKTAIPLSAVGKPDKKVLRARYWGGTGRFVN
jgi:hypothetical protein